ncbi:MAG: hypothetical protein A3C11_01150 [Candidatus Sungbacteria bacterium RIFCSPHIGHO2_02_FULL_49_12]|uniref:HicB-like antitoxin of toxin-antitoxin system domain-containing protein n=1 Tax=Candidatus Sungbacteria bacterium RIFCSPHIGHO2_02_FULL_49_12 TaxID=1802271 RepID=A0A1G2KPA5_9BACT|nr:MAG: hypothetical protein A3C11_01150 [Candidatus Sungbacteria bacterium RIFCSPHIGHO2_02_FULL_49_12]
MKGQKTIHSYSVFYETARGGGYVAYVPTLPGCHTQGETLEEAEKNIREAVELYLESMTLHNESIPQESKSFQSTIYIPTPLRTF